MDGTGCVYCRERPIDPAWRPFCSERCKLLDLRDWVDERYRIPDDTGPSLPEQIPFSEEADTDDSGPTSHSGRRTSRKQR